MKENPKVNLEKFNLFLGEEGKAEVYFINGLKLYKHYLFNESFNYYNKVDDIEVQSKITY